MKQTNPSKTTLKTQPWIHKYIDIEKKKKKKKKKNIHDGSKIKGIKERKIVRLRKARSENAVLHH